MSVRKPTEAERKEIDLFLRKGINLEADIEASSQKVREASKQAYKQEWLDVRLMCAAVLRWLQEFKANTPGLTNESISERLVLISLFCQGATYTERLISEGQYLKAAAVLKQDYELLTRIHEVKKGRYRSGRVPNVRHAPSGSQRFYGQLNDVAHPSNLNLLQPLLHRLDTEDIHGVSPIPSFNGEVACGLYELHVWIMFEITREAIILAVEMYGNADPGIEKALVWFSHITKLLEAAGFQSYHGEDPA